MESTIDNSTLSTSMVATRSDATAWYALRVFFNRWGALTSDVEEHGWEYFRPSEVIASLFFVRCTEGEILDLAAQHHDSLAVYRLPGSRKPARIGDREMEVFRFVVTAGRQGLTLLGDDRPEYHMGDRVMVTQGPFKGAEGHIKRIKRDRRLVVTIPGVVAVATAYIHPDFLKKID